MGALSCPEVHAISTGEELAAREEWGLVRVRFRLGKICIWGAACFGLWLYLGNRYVLAWPNCLVKHGTMVLLALGFGWFSSRAAVRYERRSLLLPLILILSFSIGEVHRAILRHAYRLEDASEDSRSEVPLSRPFTTTDLQVTRHILRAPASEDRLRVVQLTDLHFSSALPWDYYRSIVDRTNAAEADIVVLTGDYVSKLESVPLLERWLEEPLRARYGVYAVLGNHDYWAGVSDRVRQLLERANIHVLSGLCTQLQGVAPPDWLICGTEAPWGPDFVDAPQRSKDKVLVLSHTPDNIYSLRSRARVVFSGHNHGGQWRIPGVGALIVPSNYGRRFDRGHFTVEGTELFVSAGLGADFPPLRLYCRPELLIVDIDSRETDSGIDRIEIAANLGTDDR